MKQQFFIFLTLVPFLSQAEILEGVAKNKKGEVLYLEKHNIKIDEAGLNRSIQVEYSKPDGAVFAKMSSLFTSNKTIPETVFEDFRFKRKLSLRLIDKNVEFEESKDDEVVTKKQVLYDALMVASQGFDNFIKLNFSKLEAAPVDFKFGVLENKDFYSLTGYKKSSSSSEEIEFGIKASSWLIRLFASELSVKYDSSTKRLKSFSGRSNILDDAGNSQDAVITYQWKSGP